MSALSSGRAYVGFGTHGSLGRAVLLGVLLGAGPQGAAAASVATPALDGERLGLFDGSEFRATSGRCGDCPPPRAALWYFEDDLVAVPGPGRKVAGYDAASSAIVDAGRWSAEYDGASGVPLPALVWLGSPELVRHGRLGAAGETIEDGEGRTLPLV